MTEEMAGGGKGEDRLCLYCQTSAFSFKGPSSVSSRAERRPEVLHPFSEIPQRQSIGANILLLQERY